MWRTRAGRGRHRRLAPSRAGTGGYADSAEQLLVRVFVEADDQLAPLSKRRRPKIASRPEQEPEQLGARRLLALQVEVDDLLPLGDVELVHLLQGRKRGIPLDRGFLRIGLRGDGNLVFRKEPLRLGAGGSALAVIAPVDGAHMVLPMSRAIT